MLNRLWVRLLVAFLLVAWLAIGTVAVVVRSATETSFRHYVNQYNTSVDEELVGKLQDHYRTTGSWDEADDLLPGRGRGQGQGQGQSGSQLVVADITGTIVAASDPTLVGSRLDEQAQSSATPLQVEEQQVGWLARETPGTRALGQTEQRFIADTTNWLIAAALVAALLAIIVSVALSRQLSRPLRDLTDATHDLTAGALGQQVEVKGTAEINNLVDAFNLMSHDLAAGEALRQRMTADIAHELRTPVSILRGHVEAMLDGIYPLDGKHLAVAYDQTIHLARLIEDLRLLTLAEAGQLPLELATVAPGVLAAQAVEHFMPLAIDANVKLTQDIAADLPSVCVDVGRIHQILGNLLSNALHHTPPGPDGWITLRVTPYEDKVQFTVSNSGVGLTSEQTAYVFERFWRAENAREHDRGGSGLGLAIAQQLVTLHGGRIWVDSEPGIQTVFAFELPALSIAQNSGGGKNFTAETRRAQR